MSTFDPEILEMMQYGFESGVEEDFEEKLAKFKPKKYLGKMRKKFGLKRNPNEGMGYIERGLFGEGKGERAMFKGYRRVLKEDVARRRSQVDKLMGTKKPNKKKLGKRRAQLADAERELKRFKKATKLNKPSKVQRGLVMGGAAAVPVFAGGLGAAGGYLAGNN